ncbi:MAG: dTDP-4-dehydrorhamnose reductase [Gammaproteobacteria bacterium]|nr:dTDP-4-dehydrorhamnose reductase [Gammaproteobacteria bacterium]
MTRGVKRILLVGKNGQVGWELQRTLAPLGEVFAVDRQGMDLTDPDSIRRVIRDSRPDLIVNAAAYTAVDKAESEVDMAMAINGSAPGIMAEEMRRLGGALVHYSTDYVFDGVKTRPYVEDDPVNPLGVYGVSKLAGERAIQAAGIPHLIFRTSWVYGARGKNFLLTMLRLSKERDELRVVADQIGAPTWSRMIAEMTGQVLACSTAPKGVPVSEVSGTYHLTGSGSTSWFGFTQAILENVAQRTHSPPPRLVPITTRDYPTPAQRPANSQLSNAKLANVFGLVSPAWDSQLHLCMRELAI